MIYAGRGETHGRRAMRRHFAPAPILYAEFRQPRGPAECSGVTPRKTFLKKILPCVQQSDFMRLMRAGQYIQPSGGCFVCSFSALALGLLAKHGASTRGLD